MFSEAWNAFVKKGYKLVGFFRMLIKEGPYIYFDKVFSMFKSLQ